MTNSNCMALTNFIFKNLDTSLWTIWKTCPDSKLMDRFMIILRARKSTEIYNELINDRIIINKDEYVCGLIDPNIEYMRVVLHTNDSKLVADLTSLKFVAISQYEVFPNTHIVRSYIPDKQTAIKFHKIEQDVGELHKDLLDEIEWHTAKLTTTKAPPSTPESFPPFHTVTQGSDTPQSSPPLLTILSSSPATLYKKWF